MKHYRYLIIFAIWLYMVAFFQTRVNMSVVVLKLSDKPSTKNDNSKGSYQWTTMDKNKLLASFFYGYVAGQFIGGLISFYIGAKRSITICLILSSILVAICPLLEPYGLIPLSICRAFLGFLSGPLFASKNLLVGEWGPTGERSFINSIVHSGVLFGVVFSNLIGGIMSNSLILVEGWKQFLYISAAFNAVTALVWVILVGDSPLNHQWVSQEEKAYIKKNTIQKADPNPNFYKRVPYKHLFLSPQVWLQTLALFAHLSIFFTFLISLPLFLKDVFKVTNDKASYYSIIPFSGNFVVIVAYPILIDYLRVNKGYNVTKLRRFSSGLAYVGACVCLVPLGYVPIHTPIYAIILVTIAMCFLACNYTGFITAAIELAPQYSGIIVGINNTFASTTGFIIQLVNAKLIKLHGEVIGWRYTFFFISASCLLCGLPYVFFGSSELQDWAKPKKIETDVDLE